MGAFQKSRGHQPDHLRGHKEQSSGELIAKLNKAGVPCGPINRMDEVFADPQVRHLGMAAAGAACRAGRYRGRQPADQAQADAEPDRTTDPRKGRAHREMLKEYGYNDRSIAEFRARKIV